MQTKSSILRFTLFASSIVLSSSAEAQQFQKVLEGPLVTTLSGSRSCNFLDFNGDHFQDILLTNGKSGGEDNMLYLNDGFGNFTLYEDTMIHDGSPSDGATCADYNNDGFVDAYVANWYNVDNLLYENINGTGFNRIGSGAIATDNGYSETASWGDYDDDGFVDLYVTNSEGNKKNFLYHNLGNGSFERILTGAPATEAFTSRCVNWIDYDRDGDQDLFVTNEGNTKNNLYQNDGTGVFTKILTGPLVADNLTSMSSSWGDYDNDGDFDVFIANHEQASQLFSNDGAGNFTLTPGIWDQEVGCSFSSSFGDYDNDGFLDLFITNGFCAPNLTNFLYRNLGNGTFEKILSEEVAIDTGSSYGCAWGDIENDGFLDLIVANWQQESQENNLYKNLGNSNGWLELELEGVISNKSAIGAIISCTATINGQSVTQTREVSAQSGYCSQNSLVVHFGLGNATEITDIGIFWPSGIEESFGNLQLNTFYKVIEGQGIGILGFSEPLDDQRKMLAYPNPTTDQLIVQIPTFVGEEITVSLMNDQGKILVEKNITSAADLYIFEYADADLFSAGTYYLTVKSGGKKDVLRVQIVN